MSTKLGNILVERIGHSMQISSRSSEDKTVVRFRQTIKQWSSLLNAQTANNVASLQYSKSNRIPNIVIAQGYVMILKHEEKQRHKQSTIQWYEFQFSLV